MQVLFLSVDDPKRIVRPQPHTDRAHPTSQPPSWDHTPAQPPPLTPPPPSTALQHKPLAFTRAFVDVGGAASCTKGREVEVQVALAETHPAALVGPRVQACAPKPESQAQLSAPQADSPQVLQMCQPQAQAQAPESAPAPTAASMLAVSVTGVPAHSGTGAGTDLPLANAAATATGPHTAPATAGTSAEPQQEQREHAQSHSNNKRQSQQEQCSTGTSHRSEEAELHGLGHLRAIVAALSSCFAGIIKNEGR